MEQIRIFEVGGCVRDELMGFPTKDVDFAVEAPSFDAMREWLQDKGFKIFVETEKFLTIRAKPPKGSALEQRTNGADFVLCRKDSDSGDGRRPDFVEPGTIFDDLARRDFTINAIAMDVETGEFIDPHFGVEDCSNKLLRFVGDPFKRIEEDGLRVLRGFRFQITKGLFPTMDTDDALHSIVAANLLASPSVSVERVREELSRMFKHDTLATMQLIGGMSSVMREAIFKDGLRLEATTKK